MVQTAQKTNGAADPRFPFGIDPRYYGLSKLEYDRSIEHHRQMEHHAVMQEQSDRHSKAMEWNRVERERIAELRAAKNWWLEPLNAACKWCGGAFWCVVWFWVIVSVSSAISDANKATNERLAKAAITSCLADLDACKRGVGGAWMKEAVR